MPLLTGVEDGLRASDLAHQHLHGLLTSLPLTRNPFMAASIVASLALTLGVYEYLAGAFEAAVVAIIGAVIGPAGLAMTIGVGVTAGVSSADRGWGTVDYGAVLPGRRSRGRARRYRTLAAPRDGSAVFTLAGLLLHHQIADIMHIWAFPAGYGVARALRRVRPGWPVDLHVSI